MPTVEEKEDAIWAWVQAATGLPEGSVVWADQNDAQRARPFVTLRIGDHLQVGAVDAVQSYTDLTRPAGQEVELRVEALRDFAVTVQAFTSQTHGTPSARTLLQRVQTALGLPSVREALRAAELVPYDAGSVINLSALDVADFEGRASLGVRFYTADTASEYVGYMAQATITDQTGDGVITAPNEGENP